MNALALIWQSASFQCCLQVTEQMLAAFDVHTCAELLMRRAEIAHVFSPITMDFFLHVALGLGGTCTPDKAGEEENRKGISCERTFAVISRKEDLHQKVSELAEGLSQQMAEEALSGKCVTLKLKDKGFQVCFMAPYKSMYCVCAA
jgi:DNA polymerase kappa